MEWILIVLDGLLLTFILCFSLIQLNLSFLYVRSKKKEKSSVDQLEDSDVPLVTVQLPIYNELYVVERLIDAIAEFEYPKERFEIQILDDSTDETVELVAKKVEELTAKGYQISQVIRKDREGYKAGALAYGMEKAKGEFIAIFDADFVPAKDFLRRTIPFFKDKKIGVVQSKWEHINKDYSILTKMQAFALDAHFTVEQTGRNYGDHFINFNGTAGVWRKECIIDAGGWEADTITEDLDLSYRAQLKDWKFKYVEDLGSPAELPAAMNALKTQQFRWTKGAAECTRKNLIKVLKADNVSFSTKVHAVFHLMNAVIFLSIFGTALLSVPMVVVKNTNPDLSFLFKIASIYVLSLVFLMVYYWVSYNHDGKKGFLGFIKFLLLFPIFLSISMGMSLHNSLAVLEGFMGKKTPFLRTPKFNLANNAGTWKNKKYLVSALSPLTILEGLMAVYFLFGIFLSVKYGDLGMVPFFAMLFFGFGYIFILTIKHSRYA